MTTFTLTEAQLRASTHDGLVEYCLGLMRTCNLHIAAAEHIAQVLEETATATGQWPAVTT